MSRLIHIYHVRTTGISRRRPLVLVTEDDNAGLPDEEYEDSTSLEGSGLEDTGSETDEEMDWRGMLSEEERGLQEARVEPAEEGSDEEDDWEAFESAGSSGSKRHRGRGKLKKAPNTLEERAIVCIAIGQRYVC